MIQEITIVTAAGVKTHTIGSKVNGKIIHNIKRAPLYFQGDPFDHYCGYDETGDLLFSVYPLTPCEVVYI